MTQTKFQQILLYILQMAGKPLHLAVLLRTVKDCKECADSFVKPFAMDDGKKSMYIIIIKGFDPNSEFNNKYSSFYQAFNYDKNTMIVSSTKQPNTSSFSSSETTCLDNSISKNKDYVYTPKLGSCDCIDWL